MKKTHKFKKLTLAVTTIRHLSLARIRGGMNVELWTDPETDPTSNLTRICTLTYCDQTGCLGP